MKDSQILSTLQDLPAQSLSASPPAPLLYDACHVGVVLRAVFFVEAVVGVAALYGTANWLNWAEEVALLTGAALPAVLAWLVATCSLKKFIAKLAQRDQIVVGVALGALAGMYGCGLLAWGGFVGNAPWLASALTGAALAYGVVYALLARAEQLRPANTAARLDELQARIRPHFLFNTLNSAIALVQTEPARAEAVLLDLSELFRAALADHADASNLAHELDLARRYLAIEQVRFGERLNLEWSIDETVGDVRLPPLLLQPLVENAVRHGVELSEGVTQVKVSTQRRGTVAQIKVTNTVPLGNKRAEIGAGIALNNVRERLALMHDVQCRFQAGLRDGLYQVRIEVPCGPTSLL